MNFKIRFLIISAVVILTSCADRSKKSTCDECVKIGSQNWAKKNLDVSVFRNGDPIPEVQSVEEWIEFGKNKRPAWCYSENIFSNGEKYGKLYNWYAVSDSRKLAPVGWHIPTDDDWTKLTSYLGGEKDAAEKMKASGEWQDNCNGTNSSGFSALPGGGRGNLGWFQDVGSYCGWWSSSDYNPSSGWARVLSCQNEFVERYQYDKIDGFSIRCLKD